MSDDEFVSKKNRVLTRSKILTTILSKKNKWSLWNIEAFVGTSFALRQFQKVFKLNENAVTNIEELLRKRVLNSIKNEKEEANRESSEESRERTPVDENFSEPCGTNLKEEKEDQKKKDACLDKESPLPSSHDFLFDFQELLLKLMIPCSRKHFLSRIHSIIGKSLPAGIENPLGNDSRSVQAVNLPVEVRLYILSALVEHRMMNDVSQSIDEFHDACSLRPQELGKDSMGNTYWFFHDMKVWVELKKVPIYEPDEPVSSDGATWEWAYDMVTSRCNWLCVADYESDANSWEEVINVLKADSAKTSKAVILLYLKMRPKFEKEMAWREAERIRIEEENKKAELARLRELEKQFRTEDHGGYGLRVSARLREKVDDLKEKKRKEREEEELWDEVVDGKRPRKRAKYEEDSDYEMDMNEEERRIRPSRGIIADPSHGMSREERFAMRQARFLDTTDVRTASQHIRDASEESESSGSQKRAPIGVGDQGELVFRLLKSQTCEEGENERSGSETSKENEKAESLGQNGQSAQNGKAHEIGSDAQKEKNYDNCSDRHENIKEKSCSDFDSENSFG